MPFLFRRTTDSSPPLPLKRAQCFTLCKSFYEISLSKTECLPTPLSKKGGKRKKTIHSFDSEWLPLDRASSLNTDKKAIKLVQETGFIGSEYHSQPVL